MQIRSRDAAGNLATVFTPTLATAAAVAEKQADMQQFLATNDLTTVTGLQQALATVLALDGVDLTQVNALAEKQNPQLLAKAR